MLASLFKPQAPAITHRNVQLPAQQAWGAAAPRSANSGPCRRRQQLCRPPRAGDFQRSPLFESEIFQKEMNDMFQELSSLNGMIAKFGDFDIEGKKLFLQHIEGLVDKVKVSMARVRLAANDPLGQEMLRRQAVQMLEANTNMEMMFEGMNRTLDEMRSVIAREEATCDPAVLAAIKREWEERFRLVGKMNVDAVAQDPLVAQGSMDPQALKAANEVMESPAAIEKYASNAPLYAFLKAIVLGQR